jgi:peroxiredoxin
MGQLCLHASSLKAQNKVVESPPRQEGAMSSAHRVALIYGEISNPDSLGPLILTSSPFFVDAKSNFGKKIDELETFPGNLFDGVMNPMVRKFSAIVPLGDRPGYFSLSVGTRMLLDQFLVLPGDSLKINLNLAGFEISFAGENAWFYEAQYASKREIDRTKFDDPRQLVLSSKSTIMTRDSNQELIEKEAGKFGSELTVKGGKASLEEALEKLSSAETELASSLELLGFYTRHLNPDQMDLLKLELYSQYYFGKLNTIRNFHYEKLDSYFDAEEKSAFMDQLAQAMDQIPEDRFMEASKLVSASYLDMAIEKTILESLLRRSGFKAQVMQDYQGELAERLMAGFLSRYLGQYPNPEAVIEDYLPAMDIDPWKSRVFSLRNAHVPGQEIRDMDMIDLEGNAVTSAVFEGKPTVLYVYFSTCNHSAEYFQSFLYPMYEELQAKGYRLIALSVDEDEALWRSGISRYSNTELLNLNISGDDREALIYQYEIFSYPKTILLDGQGKVLSFNIQGNTEAERKSMLLKTLTQDPGDFSTPKTESR